MRHKIEVNGFYVNFNKRIYLFFILIIIITLLIVNIAMEINQRAQNDELSSPLLHWDDDDDYADADVKFCSEYMKT